MRLDVATSDESVADGQQECTGGVQGSVKSGEVREGDHRIEA